MTRYTPQEEGIYDAMVGGVQSGLDPMFAWQVYTDLVSGAQARAADRRATIGAEAQGLQDIVLQLAQSGATEDALMGLLGSNDLGGGRYASNQESGLMDLVRGLDWDPNSGLSGLVPADMRAALSGEAGLPPEARMEIAQGIRAAADSAAAETGEQASAQDFWNTFNSIASIYPDVDRTELLDLAVTQWASAGGARPNAAYQQLQGAPGTTSNIYEQQLRQQFGPPVPDVYPKDPTAPLPSGSPLTSLQDFMSSPYRG